MKGYAASTKSPKHKLNTRPRLARGVSVLLLGRTRCAAHRPFFVVFVSAAKRRRVERGDKDLDQSPNYVWRGDGSGIFNNANVGYVRHIRLHEPPQH